jgi:hypothetical protein
MNWFRNNLRHGVSLALAALAINVVLAFGHVHAGTTSGHEPAVSVLLPANADNHIAPGGSNGGDDDACLICKALAALSTGLAAVPPDLPAHLAYACVGPISVVEPIVWRSQVAGFRSRAPPAKLTSLT